jgi:hypothetical protein
VNEIQQPSDIKPNKQQHHYHHSPKTQNQKIHQEYERTNSAETTPKDSYRIKRQQKQVGIVQTIRVLEQASNVKTSSKT